ncbi:MAG: OmpA family protein [Sandaracinaceae bacterium]
MRRIIPWLAFFLCACGAGTTPMRLGRVVLYQSGVGYFERSGRTDAEGVRLRLAAHEVDDVLTTLTVLDTERPEDATAPSLVIPRDSVQPGESLAVTVGLGGAARESVTLAYSAPTSAWRASYRLVLPEERGGDEAWLQAWAVVDNTTAEDWQDVELTLATDAPLSFAVDLRTPRVVDRPNVTGHRVPAIAFGPVRAERSTRGERDGDGIRDEDDLCPDEPEDEDGFQDTDGCPDPDNDADGILDVDDSCPDEGEVYNGIDDENGCPDRGQVVITEQRYQIVEQIHFPADSVTFTAASRPVVDAAAQTLNANPQIRRLEIEGHADPAEASAWRLSAERAAMVRAALVERGVASERLVTRAYGGTRPLSPDSAEQNRRVSFRIEALSEDTAPEGNAPRPGVRRETLAASQRTTPLPQTGSGGTRFPVARGVSIPAGSSAMVTILHRPVTGEDVLLYRVDPQVPLSAQHPFRAARLVNRSGVDLIEGPISSSPTVRWWARGSSGAPRGRERLRASTWSTPRTHVERSDAVEETPARIGLRGTRLLGRADGHAPDHLQRRRWRPGGRASSSGTPGHRATSPAELPPSTGVEPDGAARADAAPARRGRGAHDRGAPRGGGLTTSSRTWPSTSSLYLAGSDLEARGRGAAAVALRGAGGARPIQEEAQPLKPAARGDRAAERGASAERRLARRAGGPEQLPSGVGWPSGWPRR